MYEKPGWQKHQKVRYQKTEFGMGDIAHCYNDHLGLEHENPHHKKLWWAVQKQINKAPVEDSLLQSL